MSMLLRQLLPPEHIVVPLEATTLRGAVLEIAGHLQRSGALHDAQPIEKALATARGRDVVSIGPSVALPHFRTDAVETLVLGLGVTNRPVDVSETTLTNRPRIVALVLAPPEAATRYLQTVAALAALFREDDVIERMTAATSAEQVLSIPELAEARVQPNLRVRDVMVHRTLGVPPTATVRAAVDLMLQNGWRALPVLGAKGEVLGLLTEWNVMQALLPEIPQVGGPPSTPGPLVKDVMSRSVLCVAEEMGLEEVVNLMVNKNVEQVPVVNEGIMTGVLVRTDIIRKLFGR